MKTIINLAALKKNIGKKNRSSITKRQKKYFCGTVTDISLL